MLHDYRRQVAPDDSINKRGSEKASIWDWFLVVLLPIIILFGVSAMFKYCV